MTTRAGEADPARIRDSLPEPECGAFLGEYRQAARAAADDPARYRELQRLLHTWRLRAMRHDDPDFERRRAEAANPPAGAYVPASQVMPELDARLQGHG